MKKLSFWVLKLINPTNEELVNELMSIISVRKDKREQLQVFEMFEKKMIEIMEIERKRCRSTESAIERFNPTRKVIDDVYNQPIKK